LTRIWTARSPL